MRSAGLLLLSLLFFGARAWAQEPPTAPAVPAEPPPASTEVNVPEPPPVKGTGVRITFLPPPFKGTLSLGVYAKGKLVRTLRHEAIPDKDFTVGLNGLILQWDGLDDAGRPAPAGLYQVRGFAVGQVEVEGDAFLGNDWIEDDASPRVVEVRGIALEGGGDKLVVEAQVQGGGVVEFVCTPAGEVSPLAAGTRAARAKPEKMGALPPDVKPLAQCAGRDGSVWAIEKEEGGYAVTQYAANGEPIRTLAIAAGEPVPEAVVAARNAEVLYLLERNAAEQRVRGLALASAGAGESTWKTVLEKRLVKGERPEVVLPALGRPLPEAKFTTRTLPNPLTKNAQGQANLTMQVDAEGSVLATADGLPLHRVTDTPKLKWAVLLRGEKGRPATLLQSDGVVVESFRLRKLTQMMAFDAGEYELKR